MSSEKTCGNCRYWKLEEMIKDGADNFIAPCVNIKSPYKNKKSSIDSSCGEFKREY